MERMRLGMFILLVIVLFSGCSIDTDDETGPKLLAVSYFENDADGWIAEFAEYHEGLEDSMRFAYDFGSVNVDGVGDLTVNIQEGFATNSDLFMFIKQQISGLQPNSRYLVVFNVEFNAQLLEEYTGLLDTLYLGSYLKAGVFTEEPLTKVIPDPENKDLNLVVTDFDIGSAAHEAGADMANLGFIEHTMIGASPIILLGDNLDEPIYANSDADGKVWLAVGIDSNVPIYQAIKYSTIITEFEYVKPF